MSKNFDDFLAFLYLLTRWLRCEIVPRLKRGLDEKDIYRIWPQPYVMDLLFKYKDGVINWYGVSRVTDLMEKEWQQRSS